MKVKQLRVLYSAESIQKRIRELGKKIDSFYTDEPLVMICVLKGAFMFFSDLVKCVSVSPEIDFVRLTSYTDATSASGVISFTKDVEISLTGKHVLLVEDIVDSGHTMDFLIRQMSARGAKSLRVAALVDKKERREVDIAVDFVGFPLQAGFIVGYGLDYAERYRNLPAVYVADMEP